MIDFSWHNVDKAQDVMLRKLLGSPEFALLLQVIESQVKLNQIQALRDAVRTDSTLKLDIANESLKKAERYQHCIQVLSELAQRQEMFALIQLK